MKGKFSRIINILCLTVILLICFYANNAAMAYSETDLGYVGWNENGPTMLEIDNNGQIYALIGSHRNNDYAIVYIKKYNGSSWYDYPSIATNDYCFHVSAESIFVPSIGRPVISFVASNMYNGGVPSYGYVYYYNGSSWIQLLRTSSVKYKLVLAPDDSVWVGGSDGTLYRFNGSSLENKGNIGFGISSMGIDYSGALWAGGTGGQTAMNNGSSWISKASITGGSVRSFLVSPTGDFWALAGTSACRYTGSVWEIKRTVDAGSYSWMYDFAPDGTLVVRGKRGSDNVLYLIQLETHCGEGCADFYKLYKRVYDKNSFNLVPNLSAPLSGQLVVDTRFDSTGSVKYGTVEYSTNGVNFFDLSVIDNGGLYYLTPTSNSYWFRLKWVARNSSINSWQTYYSNAYGPVPTISSAPSVSNSTGIKTWDASKGRSWVVLSWSALTNANGYKLQIFDGNEYRLRDLGNVTSWDSRTRLVFPYPANLPENNTISSDPFRWDASGLDFEDTAVRLYRSTPGTSYDTTQGYYFKVSAYNSWMETTGTLVYLVLPNATDSVAPSGTISVTVPEGATAPATVTVNLSAVVDNSGGSGLCQTRYSNDGASYSSWEAFAVSKQWVTSTGEGQKTIYAQVKDLVGNTNTLSVSFWLGATLTQIYNESQSSNQKAEAGRQAAVDARASADAAKTSAQSAATSANIASTYATNAYNAVNNSYGNTITAVRDSGGTVLQEARQANTKLDSIQSSVTNIQNSIGADTMPPTVKIRTVSGAVATSNHYIQAVLEISDNTNSTFTYSLDGVNYEPVPANRFITLTVNNPGPNLIMVWVKDQAGNIGSTSITIRKL